jgi:hypothetical protein
VRIVAQRGRALGLPGKHPYIRECRRIRALRTILEHEVSADYQSGARAEHFEDSVGVGWYPIDIHYWFVDVGVDHPAFPDLQMAAMTGEVKGAPDSLEAAALALDVRRRYGL